MGTIKGKLKTPTPNGADILHPETSADQLVPLDSKTYTKWGANNENIIASTANSNEAATFFFMYVKPKGWYKPWRVKFKITVTCPNASTYYSTSWCEVYGRQESMIYKFFNERYDPAYYHISGNYVREAGFNNGLRHALGVNLLYSKNYTNANYPRNVQVDLLDYEDCEAELLNILQKNVGLEGYNSANDTNRYRNINTNMNGVDRGLQETGDATDVQTIYTYYDRFKAGPNGIMQNSLMMQTQNGFWESFTTTNGTGTSKTKNTNGFIPGTLCYNARGSVTTSGNLVDNSNVRWFAPLINYQYSTNAGTTLTGNQTLYIVGTIKDDGLFYLADTWWSDTLPNTDDGLLYIPIGTIYNDGAGKTYRCDFSGWHTPIRYNGTRYVSVWGDYLLKTGGTIKGNLIVKETTGDAGADAPIVSVFNNDSNYFFVAVDNSEGSGHDAMFDFESNLEEAISIHFPAKNGTVAFTDDIPSSPDDIGAAPASHTHTKSQITDFPSSLPASDVYSWAKAATKPTYGATEITYGSTNVGAAIDAINTTLGSNDTDLDTIQEIVTYIKSNKTLIDSVTTTKQDKITTTNKLSYSLISGTPTIPTKTSQLTNDSSFLTGITKTMVTTALGYTPPTENTWRGIQNVLTSDSTTDSLAAAQGKVLKGLIDGLSNDKSDKGHTHFYAGSDTAGGDATKAVISTALGNSDNNKVTFQKQNVLNNASPQLSVTYQPGITSSTATYVYTLPKANCTLASTDDIVSVSGANDGTNWTSLTIGGVTKNIPAGGGGGGGTVSGDYLPLTGGTLTGNLTVGSLNSSSTEKNAYIYGSVIASSNNTEPLKIRYDSDNYFMTVKDHDYSKSVYFDFSGMSYTSTGDRVIQFPLTANITEKVAYQSNFSGVNDGTNWTSITINGVTKNIPSGGSGGGTTYQPATQTTDGLMSKDDKIALDGIIEEFSLDDTEEAHIVRKADLDYIVGNIEDLLAAIIG